MHGLGYTASSIKVLLTPSAFTEIYHDLLILYPLWNLGINKGCELFSGHIVVLKRRCCNGYVVCKKSL